MGFTHLHVHTEYSLLDGAARIKDLVASAKNQGMDSIAITDHGVMFGAVDFWNECKKQGINGIIGCEVYTAPRSRFNKEPQDKEYNHLILLAENNEGYKNLMKIVSRGFTEGFYYKPRIDKEVLREFSEGLICMSACLAGEIPRALLRDDYSRARNVALEFIDIYGKENFFLEIQDHGLEEQYKILPDMKRLSKELDIPLVATNDVHYITKEGAKAHDVLLGIQTGSTIDKEDRMTFPNDEFYLKSEEEMLQIFSHTPESVENTQLIAKRCKVEMEFGTLKLPDFKSPDGKENKDYLKELCLQGLEERYAVINNDLMKRLEYELSIIEEMGYVEYFLIVWDFINFAKSNNIPVGPGRGSAAGSIVSYTLGITDIDPIEHKLIFERFLNPERVSMPDIDIDFSDESRHKVIEYVIEKYGKEKVTQIITFGTMKAKAAIRDVARVLNVNYSKASDIAKNIPNILNITIEKSLNINPELRQMYENDPETKKVIDTAMAIEGMPRHASTHAAGVVITKNNVDDYVPLYLGDKGISTQFPMTTIEKLGLLKMDFLGLRNLSVIQNAKRMIFENHGVVVDFSNRKYDDPTVFEMISKGNTQGIFQLESGGMTQFMKNLKPDRFEDIVAGISLYRPGPMASIPTYIHNKKNPEKITYLHPKLKDILEVTYGCLIYQEQVMQIVRDLAGYTYGRSDILRRAMGKKQMDVMLAEKGQFVRGCEINNIDRETAEAIFDQMVTFAEYGFNKSHAVGYAVIGYETGYLKAHYPQEYMAALMTSVINDGDQISKYIANCKEMGIKVLPPNINRSEKYFSIDQGHIRFGLLGIKNVGEGIVDSLIEARKDAGDYKNIFDFVKRQDTAKLNKKALLSLIKAGAFDELNANRASMIAVHESILENAQKENKNNVAGQISLFDLGNEIGKESADILEDNNRLPDIAPLSQRDNINLEKEMMGVYITGHPLGEFEEKIKGIITADNERIFKSKEDIETGVDSLLKDEDNVIISGLVISKKNFLTKKNKLMAFLTLEDLCGLVEVIVFPNLFEKIGNLLEEDKIVVVGGSLSFEEDKEPKILANFVEEIENFNKEDIKYKSFYDQKLIMDSRIDLVSNKIEEKELSIEDILTSYTNLKLEKKVRTLVSESKNSLLKVRLIGTDVKVEEILNLLKKYKGDIPVYIYTEKGGMKADQRYWVDLDSSLVDELKELIGEENVKF